MFKEAALLLLGYFAALLSGPVVQRFWPGLSPRKAEAVGTLALVFVLTAAIAITLAVQSRGS